MNNNSLGSLVSIFATKSFVVEYSVLLNYDVQKHTVTVLVYLYNVKRPNKSYVDIQTFASELWDHYHKTAAELKKAHPNLQIMSSLC